MKKIKFCLRFLVIFYLVFQIFFMWRLFNSVIQLSDVMVSRSNKSIWTLVSGSVLQTNPTVLGKICMEKVYVIFFVYTCEYNYSLIFFKYIFIGKKVRHMYFLFYPTHARGRGGVGCMIKGERNKGEKRRKNQ